MHKEVKFILSNNVKPHDKSSSYTKDCLLRNTSPSFYDHLPHREGRIAGHNTIEDLCFNALRYHHRPSDDEASVEKEKLRLMKLNCLKFPIVWELLDPDEKQGLLNDATKMLWDRLPPKAAEASEEDEERLSRLSDFVEMIVILLLSRMTQSSLEEDMKKSPNNVVLHHSIQLTLNSPKLSDALPCPPALTLGEPVSITILEDDDSLIESYQRLVRLKPVLVSQWKAETLSAKTQEIENQFVYVFNLDVPLPSLSKSF